MKAVVLQPSYLPWMGYFGLIDIADKFVFLDQVQFEHRSWQRRNRIKMPNGKAKWLSVPVTRNFGQRIDEVTINNNIDWRREHWESIRFAYSRAAFFERYSPQIEEIYRKEWQYLRELDVSLITRIAKIIGVREDRFVFASDLKPVGKKTELLIDILQKVSADEYVSGPAARPYLDVKMLRKRGLKTYWYEFAHPTYKQIYGNFLPLVSAIDLLFNEGPESLEQIRRGSEKALREAEY